MRSRHLDHGECVCGQGILILAELAILGMAGRQHGLTQEAFMSDAQHDFWQSHSLIYLEMAFRTDRQETLHNADGHGKKTGDCGDTVAFYLMVDKDRIESATYALDGCLNTNACANTIISMIEGRPVDHAWEVTPEAVAAHLETLPEDHFHCAELAVGALYLALADVREKKRAPWKKAYR